MSFFPWTHVLLKIHGKKKKEIEKKSEIEEYDVLPFDMNRLWRDGKQEKVQELVKGISRATLKEIKKKKRKVK